MTIEIKNLSKQFAPHLPPALKNINATIAAGQIVGLIGPDGAGKTTLIRLLAALLKPSEGTILIEGYDTVKNPECIHYLAGYMPQKFGLYEDLTVLQNLTLYADLKGVVGDARKETFEKLLNFTALAPFTGRLARALSGGMKQKLGLACALVKKPKLLILDEPSVGVDPISRRELWTMVSDLVKEGVSAIWSTSYLSEAEECSTTLLLSDGVLCYYGDPKNFTEKVAGRTFAITNIEGDLRKLLFEELKNKNVMDGVIQGRDLRLVLRDGKVPLPHVQMHPVPPRFEDAFVDLLGGGPGGISILAEKTPLIPHSDTAVILAEGLTKKFGAFTAVDNVSVKVEKGTIFGLLGPNGAGKTTTFKMLCGLLRPTIGKASVNGIDLQKAPAIARSQIGYMAQKFSLYGHLSVLQNLNFFAGIYHLNHSPIEEMIEIFNLQPYLGLSADTLPLGIKQRLALACANMHHPSVLFLDEPTSGVDPITRREFWNHINGLVGRGVTIMVTTHFMDEAEYCDTIALVYRGKIINKETPDNLKNFVKSEKNPNPTLEDAFVQMIKEFDEEHP